ncbi:5-oxoprolinase subunit B/C family protein [Leucobacter sp. HY1910]
MGDRAVLIECAGVTGASAGAAGAGAAAVAEVAEVAALVARLHGVTEVVPAARTVLVVCKDWRATRGVLAWAERGGVGPGTDAAASSSAHGTASEAVHGAAHSTGHSIGHRAAHVTIDVVYDGEDLALAAALVGVSGEALAAAHTNVSWRAAFGGFAPGFMYLTADNWPYRLPRLDAPRARVEAGAVALAGEFSAVYPAASPGGWQLIGRTAAPMWELERAEPALVRPGDTVEFRAVRELVRARASGTSGGGGAERTADATMGVAADLFVVSGVASDDSGPAAAPAAATFTVVRPGTQTLIQDGGRPGYRAVGVTESGAMDRAALARANEAVENPAGAAGLEILVGGLELRVERPVTVAIAGTAVSLEVHEAGERRTVLAGTPVAVHPGQRLTLAHVGPGMRDYLAVRGGVLGVVTPEGGVEPAEGTETVDTQADGTETNGAQRQGWLGSQATDTLSGIGPAPLAQGTQFGVGEVVERPLDGPRPAKAVDVVEQSEGREHTGSPGQAELPARSGQPDQPAVPVLRVLAGPRDDWFDEESLRTLTEATWTVSAQSNRVGARLSGPVLERRAAQTDDAAPAELPSEGMVRGALQVPPGGEPVLFLADHPVTGGYPVIAVVIDDDLDRAGQLAPGAPVRFAIVSADAASETGTWPAAQVAKVAQPHPARVTCTFEIDGRRHSVTMPGALAAAIDLAFAADPADAADLAHADAAHEFIAGIVRAIRNSG